MDVFKSLFRNYHKLPGFIFNKILPNSRVNLNFWNMNMAKNDSDGFRIIDRQIKRNYDKHRSWGKQQMICYAPFKNMYFGISGNVRACCRNESYIFGSYPQQTIREIWNGEKVRNLRESIRRNDLSSGCDECYNHLTGGNFTAVVARMFDNQKINKRYPSIMEFELNNTCNLECTICAGRLSSSIRKNREKLPPYQSPYNSDFVTQLEEFLPHLEEARFYGGEPFLITLYYEIWDMMIKINPHIKIYVQTNGTVLNERIKKLIEDGKFIFNISVDAMDKQVFEKLRVNADFDSVMENLMYFYNYSLRKKTFFCITPTMMRNNWQELPELIRFCNKLNIPLFYNTLYRPKHLALYTMKETELGEIARKLHAHDFQQKNNIQKQNNYYYSDFVNLLRKWKSEASEREKLKEKKLLSIEQARIKLLANLSLFFKSESTKDALSGTLRKIDRILSLFENENEITIIYNKLLETPVPIIIEQAEAIYGLDDQSIIKMVRNSL